MFLLAVMSVLAVTALADDTTAWTSEDLGPVVGEYRTGYAYYDGSGYHTDESISLPGNVVLPVSDNYRSWASFSVSTLDDRTHIETASLIFTAVSSASTDVQVKMMSREMHTLDPEIAFNIIRQAETVETISILQSGFYSVNITGDALDVLRAVVEGDDDHLVIGFHVVGNGSATITARLYDLVSMYLNIEFDDEAPAVPSLDPMDAYSTGTAFPSPGPQSPTTL